MKNKPQDIPEGPAIATALHRQDQDIFDDNANLIIGKKGWRRYDRLEWLKKRNAIAQHQYLAGRRLQEDWQLSKLESSPQMQMARSSGAATTALSDAKCDAIDRLKRAMAQLPNELATLLTLFLLPEDEPFSLERCAAIVREDRRAAAFGIRLGLTILARHYGYST